MGLTAALPRLDQSTWSCEFRPPPPYNYKNSPSGEVLATGAV
ncbi:MAG: hypothetical protein ACOYMP_11595 [Nodosilinea sp.]